MTYPTIQQIEQRDAAIRRACRDIKHAALHDLATVHICKSRAVWLRTYGLDVTPDWLALLTISRTGRRNSKRVRAELRPLLQTVA